MIRFCQECILPDTRPNLEIGEDGVCNACSAHRTKPSIDWRGRKEAFQEVVQHASSRTDRYDCVIPVSGGKDSTWQVVKCLEFGLTPLAVTWRPPGRTEIGQRNLDNLVQLGVDHIDYQINPSLERRFIRKTFERYGSTAIPMHLAIFNIPRAIAVRFDIPLIVWGENSAFEYGGAEEERSGFLLNEEWIRRYGVTNGTTATDWINEGFTIRELAAYFGPTSAELSVAGTRGVFLGYYFQWDPAETAAIAEAHGFQRRSEGARTGYYAYADIDDTFISVHHWMKWYKFGFTRLFDNLSLEIRNGRMSREDAVSILAESDEQRPVQDIAALAQFVGWSIEEFMECAEQFRNRSIWVHEAGGWRIPGHIVPDHWWR